MLSFYDTTLPELFVIGQLFICSLLLSSKMSLICHFLSCYSVPYPYIMKCRTCILIPRDYAIHMSYVIAYRRTRLNMSHEIVIIKIYVVECKIWNGNKFAVVGSQISPVHKLEYCWFGYL